MLEGDTGAATVNLLTGEALGGDFDIRRQQHHVGVGDRLRAQRRARAHRALGFDLQVIPQALGRLLQRLGGHKGVGHAGRASRNGDDTGSTLRRRCCAGDIDLGLFGTTAQYRLDIRQGLGRCALEHTLADKPLHIHRRAADQQYPFGFIECGLGQLALRVLHIHHFNAGVQAHALRGGVQQAGAQHTGDHAVRAGSNNG